MVNTGGKVQRAESTESTVDTSSALALYRTAASLYYYITWILHFTFYYNLVFTVLTSDQRDVTVPGLG